MPTGSRRSVSFADADSADRVALYYPDGVTVVEGPAGVHDQVRRLLAEAGVGQRGAAPRVGGRAVPQQHQALLRVPLVVGLARRPAQRQARQRDPCGQPRRPGAASACVVRRDVRASEPLSIIDR